MSANPRRLAFFSDGEWRQSAGLAMDCYDPSTGEAMALAAMCAAGDMEGAIAAARTQAGMVEVNVGIPVQLSVFGLGGGK